MRTSRRLKKGPIIFVVVIVLIVILVIAGINLYKYYTSYEYKLGKVGYNEKEIASLVKSDKKIINKALEKYDEDLIGLSEEKYFIWENYETYKDYINKLHKKTNDIKYDDVVAKVNTKRNYEVYTHTTSTDMNKKEAILVNKYHHLPEKYAPDDLVDVSNFYAYGTPKIRSEVYGAFKTMFNDAKKEDITLIINSGYRSYEEQKKVYNDYKEIKGEEAADNYAARPDYSEHQTGLALDVITYGTNGDVFDQTDAFKWLSKNAHKYGFILRYPKDKEDITGYSYESWHWRYVGKDLATKVYESDLTYDEYYAYYEE